MVSHRRHPSRLPFGSLRSAWTGPAAFAENVYEGMAESGLPITIVGNTKAK